MHHDCRRTVSIPSQEELQSPTPSILVVRIDLQTAGVPGQPSEGLLLKGDISILDSSVMETNRYPILKRLFRVTDLFAADNFMLRSDQRGHLLPAKL